MSLIEALQEEFNDSTYNSMSHILKTCEPVYWPREVSFTRHVLFFILENGWERFQNLNDDDMNALITDMVKMPADVNSENFCGMAISDVIADMVETARLIVESISIEEFLDYLQTALLYHGLNDFR